jgi:hypothetical protein
MQTVVNLSPYVINYINGFADMNSSQVVESIVRQYIDASRSGATNDPYVTDKIEKQRLNVQPKFTKLSPVTRKAKNLKPVKG